MSEFRKLLENYDSCKDEENYKMIESYLLKNTSITCKKKIKNLIILALWSNELEL
jgi:hypothetical protein